MTGVNHLWERLRDSFRKTPGPVFPPDTWLLDLDGFAPDGFVQGIQLLNDDGTPFEFVVQALEQHAGMDLRTAVLATRQIDRTGGVLLPFPTQEEAVRAAEAITARAAREGHPLSCRAVSIHRNSQ